MSEYPTATMVVTVDHKLQVDANYKGEPGLMLGMLGALRYSQEWCAKQLDDRANLLHDEEISNHNQCIQMSRDDALKALYGAYQSLQQRIGAISASSDKATFEIPTSIQTL